MTFPKQPDMVEAMDGYFVNKESYQKATSAAHRLTTVIEQSDVYEVMWKDPWWNGFSIDRKFPKENAQSDPVYSVDQSFMYRPWEVLGYLAAWWVGIEP